MRLLVAEPELGEGLTPEEFAHARLRVVVPVVHAPVGPFHLSDLSSLSGATGDLYGLLVLKGMLLINVRLAGRQAGRLVSTGGLVLIDGPATDTIPVEFDWLVIDQCRLACIDQRLLGTFQRWPALMSAIMRRAAQHAREALLQQAISQLPKVEDRLLALFWSLADRQGVVRPDGIWVELSATHDTLAHLVGAQRPTVSLGLTRLCESGLLQPHSGGWLINPESLRTFSKSDIGGQLDG